MEFRRVLFRSLRKSSRLRARRSMLCTTTVSPSRMKDSMASSWGAFDILARRFVGEDLIERHALKLAIDIPWLVSNSSLSQCSHYVWKIVVWRTNLEVTPRSDERGVGKECVRKCITRCAA